MTNPIEPIRRPIARRLLPLTATRPAQALTRGLASVVAWARLSNGSLRLGAADVVSPLDPQSRALLWQVLSETIATIGMLSAADVPPEAGLAALRSLAERVRERVAVAPPRPVAAWEGDPPQIFVLEFLTHDLQPCLGRWQPRLEAWRRCRRRESDWPLLRLCRGDLARTRERLVERAWQLGMALNMSGLDRLLPARPAAAPVLIAADELAGAEAGAGAPPDPASALAGWRIYLEAAARLPQSAPASGPGVLGETIAGLDALAGEIHAELKAMPPPAPNGAADTVQRLAFALLSEHLQPFLTKWRPRYRKFAASQRPEAKWRRAEECRAALSETRENCLPTIRALGRKIGAPPLADFTNPAATVEAEVPLQLPAPATRS